ncbi:hypothetical protein SPRG_14544 [Saprolegnia parasitica CBS 223.65]|uniref:Uncharacterized protein n=1 Tax=Saprolegnia parasitica (strain CBS 223.65) TaxID=695850 RepID=A0A067BME9_SAPPC|nr:hypothetical protein SPRG_14544 [Saprolegnia parasitica CBS 223.65]KDO19644.1 hypothetical protein SPRG_14544 [Saprolegnia parasitica CBS 223.65]|eukprot:XP_012209644.1 hypothetical protein SPRG_14544 [Saprolegnia parasitica CBS 223.65]
MRATRAAIVATAHKSTESAPFQLLLDCYASIKSTDNNVVELEDKLRRRPDVSLNDVIQALCDTEDPAIRLKLSVLGLSLAPIVEKMDLVVEVVHTVVTDVWSQVRKDGGRYVAKHLVPVLPLPTLEAIFIDILRLCKTDGTEWRSLDGGFYLLAMVLSTIKRVPSAGYVLGGHTLDHLPSILLTDLKPAVYSAMKNEQLSVREHATAAMTNYVAISDPFTQIGTFQEVISKLHLHSPHDVLPAAHADGLLDVAAQLVPHIPIVFLAKHWHVVFPTCEKYIMHLASTVRQKSSLLVRALATLSVEAPSDTSLRLLQSILTSLATPCSVHPDAAQRDFFWQRLEGRLMSLDAVLSLLGHHQLATTVAAIDRVECKSFLAPPPLR